MYKGSHPMHTDAMRDRMFTMRLSADEGARLDALAEHFGLNAVGTIRMLLKEKAREVGLEVPAPTPKTKAPKKR